MAHVHHTAIVVSDLDTSLRFWRDGLGLQVQLDHTFEGDWPTLLDAPDTTLRAIFLGDPDRPDAGIVELVSFPTADVATPSPAGTGTSAGFLLVSLFTDVDTALDRLRQLGLDADARGITVSGDVRMAVVRDPDGVLVELVDTVATDNVQRLQAAR